jgi:hypothetical protein
MKRFIRDRQHWLEFLKNKIVNGRDGEFENLMGDTNDNDVWLYHDCDSDISGIKSERMKELFEAYNALRIEHQIRYANIKISTDDRVSSRLQLALLGNATIIGLAALVALHIFIAMSVAINSAYTPPELLHVLVIWIAIIALAVGTLNEGLRPSREIDRYQDYRAATRGIRDRFNAAKSDAERLEVMKDLERLSFYEMREFLKIHNDAKFIL